MQKQHAIPVMVQVTQDLAVSVMPVKKYEYIMSTTQVAHGYGTTASSVRKTLERNMDELIKNKHWFKGATICPTLESEGITYSGKDIQGHQTFFTKEGVIKLGFFIKSPRAKLFRSWASELLAEKLDDAATLASMQQAMATPQPKAVTAKPRKHNRLNPQRTIAILEDLCLIEDTALRVRLTKNILGK